MTLNNCKNCESSETKNTDRTPDIQNDCLKPTIESQELSCDPSDEFSKALGYIAIYQERFKKTIKNIANGKICELKTDDVSKVHYQGSLKFYNEKAKFGFIKSSNGEEVFLHKDNLIKSRIDSKMLEICSQYFEIIFKFQTLAYKGMSSPIVKAVNIEILNFLPREIEDQ